MARFQFPLERVLRWRSVELSAEESKLEQLVREHTRLQERAAEMSAEKSRIENSPESLPGLCGVDLKGMASYRLRLMGMAEDLKKSMLQCERELLAQRKKCQIAQQRVRLLEELKSRRFSEWEDEQDSQLEALASESYLALWNRNMSE
jgi:flagellar export protein FliJ